MDKKICPILSIGEPRMITCKGEECHWHSSPICNFPEKNEALTLIEILAQDDIETHLAKKKLGWYCRLTKSGTVVAEGAADDVELALAKAYNKYKGVHKALGIGGF